MAGGRDKRQGEASRGNSYRATPDKRSVLYLYAAVSTVSPSRGSTKGGTRISITVKGTLAYYGNEDIKVSVGGQ